MLFSDSQGNNNVTGLDAASRQKLDEKQKGATGAFLTCNFLSTKWTRDKKKNKKERKRAQK